MTDKYSNQDYEDISQWYSIERSITCNYFSNLKNRTKCKEPLRKIYPAMYKKALSDYMVFGRVTRFPEKYILKWKDDILYNIAYLSAMTAIGGHTSHFPLDEFNDEFFEDQAGVADYSGACEIMDELDDEYFPLFSNGQWLISDYGLEPLLRLGEELVVTKDTTQILCLIDKVLNVVHQRSDLPELFIHGGSDSLYEISN